MKRKILICLLIVNFSFTNIYASKFRFIFSPQAKETLSESLSDSETGSIYCDTKGHWCDYSAMRLYEEGIFTGLKIGNNYYFGPDEQITRGEFLLYISAVLGTKNTSSGYLPFEDFNSIPTWQRSAVTSMFNAGIIHGNSENGKLYFNCDEGITRIEAAQILNNILNLDSEFKQTDYSDSYLIPKYASGPVKNVTDYGLMRGYDDKSFRPYIRITRGMLSDILCNLKDYCEKEPLTVQRIKNTERK